MNEAWFAKDVAPFFSLFSLLAVLSVLERYVKQGRHREAITNVFRAGAALGVLFALLAAVAWTMGQPRYVYATLALTGVLVAAGFLASMKDLKRAYAEAELRKTLASDL